MRRHLVGMLVAVAGVAACTESSSPTRALAPGGASLSQGIVASAVGSAHYMSGGELRTMSFSAVSREDGTAQGEFHVTIHAIDRFFHVNVTCLAVRNDTAWVAGIIDQTNHPAVIPGRVSYFWTTDKGEGGTTLEKMSTARINDAAGQDQVFCGLKPSESFSGLPGNTLIHGNVQVRGQ
jgi:hypothetical protein